MARGLNEAYPPETETGLSLAERHQLSLMAKALSGDMVLVVTPATDAPAPTNAAWTRDFYVELQTAAGEVHSWFNKAVASGHSVGDNGGGTASVLPATTTTFVNGIAKIVMSGNAAVWANGETATLTVAQLVVLGYTLAQKTGVLTFTTP
jgi:hypothetical protein